MMFGGNKKIRRDSKQHNCIANHTNIVFPTDKLFCNVFAADVARGKEAAPEDEKQEEDLEQDISFLEYLSTSEDELPELSNSPLWQ